VDPSLSIVAVAVLARLIPGPRTIDDAYITFRYARNLLAGHGIVYNPGEWVFGASTPGFMLLLAALGLALGGPSAPFPEIAWLLAALIDGITCWTLIKIGEELGVKPAGMAAALVWSIAPWSVSFAVGGMETSLLVCLCCLTILFFVQKRHSTAAIAGGLAWLTRPDALILLAPLALDRFRRALPSGRLNRTQEPLRVREVVLFAGPLALWSAFALWAFGSPLPHSVSAKVVAYNLAPLSGLVRLLQHYSTPFLGHETLGLGWIKVGIVLYPALFILGSAAMIRRRPDSWAFLVYPWLYFGIFSAFNPLIFRWYLTPPLPMLMFGIFLGLLRLARDFKIERFFPLVVAPAFVLTLLGWTLHPDHGPDRPAPEMAYIQLELLYQQAAERLEGEIRPSQVLAAGDIGTLGYYTGARMLDTVGLVSPQSVSYYPLPESMYVINYAVPPALIHEEQPDFLVILEVYGREGLLKDPEFQREYELIDLIPTDMYGSEEGMLIYRRAMSDKP
jgi:arabinofuranosyltransferase